MSVELIRELYDYHRWANRRLFDVAAGLDASAERGDIWFSRVVRDKVDFRL